MIVESNSACKCHFLCLFRKTFRVAFKSNGNVVTMKQVSDSFCADKKSFTSRCSLLNRTSTSGQCRRIFWIRSHLSCSYRHAPSMRPVICRSLGPRHFLDLWHPDLVRFLFNGNCSALFSRTIIRTLNQHIMEDWSRSSLRATPV